ncbi:uncharacterized protein K02A2.6-like [Drosophila montana]|uniref:uncharacterized protein K02A2.6-like n=1 Tax=Drosophila montana TaxID=40370 RepID=UPI00313DAC87
MFLRDHIFTQFGVPEIIHTDNGRQFTSNEFAEFTSKYGFTHQKAGNYAPQANASERVNQFVLAAIRIHVGDNARWDEQLPEIAAALRSAIHNRIGTSPYFAMFGHHMFTNGADYKLARRLKAVSDTEVQNLARVEKHQIYRARIQRYTSVTSSLVTSQKAATPSSATSTPSAES